MSEYDWDFRALLALDNEEYKATMGEHIQQMLDTANEGKQDPAASIFDAVGRAKLARETEGDKE